MKLVRCSFTPTSSSQITTFHKVFLATWYIHVLPSPAHHASSLPHPLYNHCKNPVTFMSCRRRVMSEQQIVASDHTSLPLCVLQHIHSRLAPRAPLRLLGYSFGGLLALELVAEGREGKLYIVDSARDFLKAMLTQSMANNEDEFQSSLICAMFILIALHEATSAAVSKVHHDRNVKFYEYWNALSLGFWSFKFVALNTAGALYTQIPNYEGVLISP